MRTRWRVMLAVASGVAVLGLLLLTDTVLDPYLPDINPDIYLWAGGALAALLGGLALYQARKVEPTKLAIGAGLGAVAFLVALLGIQLFVAANMGGGYTAHVSAEAPLNGTWDNRTAEAALVAQGLDPETSAWGPVRAHAEPGDGARFSVYVVRQPVGPQAGEEPGDIRLEVTYFSPSMETSQEAARWAEEHRPELETRFQHLLERFLEETGWEQAGNVTWTSATSVE